MRKGRAELTHASSAQAGYWLRTPLWRGGTLCQGPFAGYAIDLPFVSLAPRVGLCRGGFEHVSGASSDELDLEVRAAHIWDVGRLAITVGATAGGSYLRQAAGPAIAAARDGMAHVGALAGTTIELSRGFYGGIEIDAIAYFRAEPAAPIQPAIPPLRPEIALERDSLPFALRFDILLLGMHW